MEYTEISQLKDALDKCRRCHLRDHAIAPVGYYGSVSSPLVIVGEGPGGVEDTYGIPLCGPSGQLLDKALWSVNITRDNIYTTNIVKCRPKNNRTPTFDEGCFCANNWLDAEIALLRPKVIVALGSVALKYLKDKQARITKDRGLWFDTKYGIECIATYHPAYLLRLSGQNLVKAKWEVYYDLKAALEKAQQYDKNYVYKSPKAPKLLEIFTPRTQNQP